MPRDFVDPTAKQQVIVLVDGATVRTTEHLIESCESCNEEGAQIPFDWILDRVTGCKGSVTDYILETPAKCPNCRRERDSRKDLALTGCIGQFFRRQPLTKYP